MGIYLDNAATTQPKLEVVQAMLPYIYDEWYNPSALYNKSAKAKKAIDKARKTIGDFINAEANEIFFTSGGSESNCWAIQGFINYCISKGQTPSIITSVIEHKSILSCVDNMNVDVHYVEVDDKGYINMEMLENILAFLSAHYSDNRVLVSIQFANNEIGTIQHIEDIAILVHRYNAVFHTDAVQVFGHGIIDVKDLGIDMMSASGHKIGMCKGIGFLYKKKDININPLIYGTQMDAMRGGTENVPYIVGMAKAVELCKKQWDDLMNQLATATTHVLTPADIREYMICELKSKFNAEINGDEICRLYNNINVTFPQNVTGEALIYLLEMSEIYVSAGSACNAHSTEPSYVLKAIGLTDEEAARTLRITLPEDCDKAIVDKVICELEKQIRLLAIE